MKVLVIVEGEVGPRIGGPAVRGTELARCLTDRHEVVVSAWGVQRGGAPGLRVTASSRRAVIREALRSDAVLAPWIPPYLYPALRARGRLGLADLYDPYERELLVGGGTEGARQVAVVKALTDLQLRFADGLLCASGRQQDQLADRAAALGLELPPLRVVPIGTPVQPPSDVPRVLRSAFPEIDPEDVVVLWWGPVWRWLDGDTLIETIARLAPERPELKLVVVGEPPPGTPPDLDDTASVRELAGRLGLVGRSVFFLDRRIAYEERAAWLLDADIGVVLHHDQDEAEYAARGRTADYLWAGLPSVLARGDEVGEEAGRAGAALLVPPHDIDATAQALLALVDPAARERAGAAARRLGEERRWTRVAAPLLELLDDLEPRRESSWPRLGAAVGAYYGRRLRQTLERGGGGAGGASARAARPGRSA